MKKYIYLLILPLVVCAPLYANAQDVPETGDETVLETSLSDSDIIQEMDERSEKVSGLSRPGVTFSLFFTPRELEMLNEARQGLLARMATDSELNAAQDGRSVPRGPREISVSGILYIDANDWVVWINNEKITPERIPPEITDIKVTKDSVRLKWFDAYTNQIFPIKLRTHQRFNIDTRIFLPG